MIKYIILVLRIQWKYLKKSIRNRKIVLFRIGTTTTLPKTPYIYRNVMDRSLCNGFITSQRIEIMGLIFPQHFQQLCLRHQLLIPKNRKKKFYLTYKLINHKYLQVKSCSQTNSTFFPNIVQQYSHSLTSKEQMTLFVFAF